MPSGPLTLKASNRVLCHGFNRPGFNLPTMKSLDSDKKAKKNEEAAKEGTIGGAETQANIPIADEPIDFSNYSNKDGYLVVALKHLIACFGWL